MWSYQLLIFYLITFYYTLYQHDNLNTANNFIIFGPFFNYKIEINYIKKIGNTLQ